MDSGEGELQSACRALEKFIGHQKERLDSAQKAIASLDPHVRVSRQHIDKASSVAALESLKHNLATLQGGLEALENHYHVYPDNQAVLLKTAKMWQAESSMQLQELLVQEKSRQKMLKEEIHRKSLCIQESQKVLQVLEREKANLGNKQEELERQKVLDLEEKLANVKRLYSEMKHHLKETVETYFPDPKVPGYMGMYTLLNELTMRLQNRDRDTYVKVTSAMWPYYLESLERHGIIERHPTDKEKIRIIDFSDGRLGS